MLIDTHAHIYHRRFANDRPQMIERAFDAGIKKILLPAIDVPSIELALDLCHTYEGLYAMAALHPSETKTASDKDFLEVSSFCSHSKIIAVGESGLDYYWNRSFDAMQHSFLRKHITLAIDQDLPLILHNRDASDDILKILQEERSTMAHPEGLRGVFHCFTGSIDFAGEIISLGFFVGLGGILTFKNSGLEETVREIPMEHIVLETDAPFLAPVPFRGKRNEPAYLPYVAEKLADIKGIAVDEVERITTANAAWLFGLETDHET